MSSFPLSGIPGYESKTIDFKSTEDGTIKLDVFYPDTTKGSTRTVVLHYHGGFLIVGDRYAFFPYWLVNGCISREWIFVTSDYRLIPETTAQASLEDAVDAYEWVVSTLPAELDCKVDSVFLAGSSAGAYLALATAASVQKQPSALLLIYGMLDATDPRYLTTGSNIFGRPVVETAQTLSNFPAHKDSDDRKAISRYPLTGNPALDPRFGLIAALHIDALFPDYLTGVEGLSRSILLDGVDSIPREHRNLFPLVFGDLKNLPPVMLLHGKVDSAVPVDQSTRAAEILQNSGVKVLTEFPEDAEHGFDARAGNVDIEGEDGEKVASYQSLRNALKFLDSTVKQSI